MLNPHPESLSLWSLLSSSESDSSIMVEEARGFPLRLLYWRDPWMPVDDARGVWKYRESG